MKNTYRVILIGLVLLGVVYASTGPEKKAEEEKAKSLDLCKFPVSIKAGHYIQIMECNKQKIELKQVHCRELTRDNAKFPCYKGSDVIEVRANFPAILNATIDQNGDEDILREVNLYWENGVNTIQGNGEWEELRLYLEVSNVKIYKIAPGTVEVGEITIGFRPPDDMQLEDEATCEEE